MSNIYTNVSCYNNSNTNEKLNIDINIVNISLLGIIFVLLCYIYILKNPCEDWCSVYDTITEIYDCCMCCKKTIIDDNKPIDVDIENVNSECIEDEDSVKLEIVEENGRKTIYL